MLRSRFYNFLTISLDIIVVVLSGEEPLYGNTDNKSLLLLLLLLIKIVFQVSFPNSCWWNVINIFSFIFDSWGWKVPHRTMHASGAPFTRTTDNRLHISHSYTIISFQCKNVRWRYQIAEPTPSVFHWLQNMTYKAKADLLCG
jgi:hypothetical protein